MYINIYVYKYMCEKPIYALDVPCRCTDMETSPFDRANGSSSARCGKQAARTPHKSEKCNVGRSSIGTGCRLSLLGCGYPFCWKPRRIRGSWVPTFVDSSPSYIYIYIHTHTDFCLHSAMCVHAICAMKLTALMFARYVTLTCCWKGNVCHPNHI